MKIETAKELLDFIYPIHDRTSCNDGDVNNGFYSRNSDGFGRCTRCMYIEILNGDIIPAKVLKSHEEGNDAIRG